MENTPRLYGELVELVGQHGKWLEVRQVDTLGWMVVGLIHSGGVSLTAWVPFVSGRARYAQSTQRRFARWLPNQRMEVHTLYAPLIQTALAEWGNHPLYLALDTTMVWNRYCVIRLSVIYRGRAVPLVWEVLGHSSSRVASEAYAALRAAVPPLFPLGVRVVFLADRGFAETELLAHLRRLRWHLRIRSKASCGVHRLGQRPCKVEDFKLAPGRALFQRHVAITAAHCGPVSLALARQASTGECWYGVSAEPTRVHPCVEYGWRFDIEENFLDDKSNGFPLEGSLLRNADAVARLWVVLAVTTLYLVAQGTQVVAAHNRRGVDPHWWRGNSYLRLGWQGVKTALARGWALFATLHLSGVPDPEPARASVSQSEHAPPLTFTVTYFYSPA